MKKIIPHLWFDKQAKEAAEFYTTLLADSGIEHSTTIQDTPSGDAQMITFKLAGLDFMAISAGPYFKLNPAISLFVVFDNEEAIKSMWEKLLDGGKALMEYNTYPWANKYGWVEDKYGLSWQLSWSEQHQVEQKITPLLMFTQDKAGKAEQAIKDYTSIFPNSMIDMLVPYTKDDNDTEGYLKHARFTLNGLAFMAMDSTGPHQFTFNEALSFVVNCDTQEEIDFYWEKLSAVPQAEQCGWCKDTYGVSWQIVPSMMNEIMTTGTKEQRMRVTQAFMKMKKFNIEELQKAFKGE